jgi:hypothetical protein
VAAPHPAVMYRCTRWSDASLGNGSSKRIANVVSSIGGSSIVVIVVLIIVVRHVWVVIIQRPQAVIAAIRRLHRESGEARR